MFISESQLGYKQDQYIDLMDVLPVLEDDESYYDPAMVPIVENSNYGRGMIRIEDINEFAEANGIYDMGYAISTICESSGVHPADLLFTIKEENLYLDQNLSDIVIEMVESGIPVATVPISEYDPISVMGNFAVNFFSETGSDYYLDAFANGDWFCIAQAINEGLTQDFLDQYNKYTDSLPNDRSTWTKGQTKEFELLDAFKTAASKDNNMDFDYNDYKLFKSRFRDVDVNSNGDLEVDNSDLQRAIQDLEEKRHVKSINAATGKFDRKKAFEEYRRKHPNLSTSDINKVVDAQEKEFNDYMKSQKNIGWSENGNKKGTSFTFDGATYDNAKSIKAGATKFREDLDKLMRAAKSKPSAAEEKAAKKDLKSKFADFLHFKELAKKNFNFDVQENDLIKEVRNYLNMKESAGKEAEKQGNPNAKDIKQKEGEAAIQTEGTPKTQKEAEGFFAKVKSAFDSGRVSVAKGIAWVRRKIEAFEKWLGVTPDSNPVKKVIGWLVGKLRSLMQWLENKVRPGEAGTKD